MCQAISSFQISLTVDRARSYLDRFGRASDGDGDGIAGGDHVKSVARLFGDADGDGDVDGQDREAFRDAYESGTDTFLWYFDFDADGDVDGQDNGQFNRRFGQS